MNKQQKIRFAEIDYVKGVGILLMILTHCIPDNENPLTMWMTSFNMPLFFIICGYLKAKVRDQGRNFKIFIQKRIKQLLMPYFMFGLLLTLFFQTLYLISGAELTIGKMLFELITLQGIESMWFIPCYFVAEILFLVLKERSTLFQKRFMVLLTVGLVVVKGLGMPGMWLIRLIIKCLIGVWFIWVGYELTEKEVFSKCNKVMLAVLLMLGVVISQVNGVCGIGGLQFRSILLFLISGVTGSIFLIRILSKASEKESKLLKLLEILGKNSLVVVCTNNLWVEIIRLADYKLTGNILIKTGWIGVFVFFVLMIIFELITIRIFSGKLGFLFGKK